MGRKRARVAAPITHQLCALPLGRLWGGRMGLPNGPRRANYVFFMCRSDWGPLTHAHVRLKIASKVAAQTHDVAKCGGRDFGFFEIFFLDLAYGLSHTPHATQDNCVGEHLFSGLCSSKID